MLTQGFFFYLAVDQLQLLTFSSPDSYYACNYTQKKILVIYIIIYYSNKPKSKKLSDFPSLKDLFVRIKARTFKFFSHLMAFS